MKSVSARSLVRLIVVPLGFAAAIGCAARIWPSSRGVKAEKWGFEEPDENWSRSKLVRMIEQPYNHPSRFEEDRARPGKALRTGEPGLCVSFSGGGLRSASFAIGVLSGLHDQHVLREIDRASSVSGGGYALSWYLVHHYDAWNEHRSSYDAERVDDALFDEDGAEQKWLEGVPSRPDDGMDLIADPFKGSFDLSTVQGASAVIGTIPFIGVNLVLNGLFGWHANVSPLRRFYQMRIERVFHHHEGDFTSLFVWDLGRGEKIGLGDLKEMLSDTRTSERTHLPYPIFVAAANLNHTGGSAALDVANRLYEATPAWNGSDAFGYHAKEKLDLHHAISVSGAAVDSQILLSGPPSLFAAMLDVDLGFYIDNPRYRRSRLLYKFIPFPAYYWFGFQNDQDGARIHLTDGGHAENLGAFPLFRRLCRQVLIVDGTFDPNLIFDDYRVLREALSGELGLKLEIPAIDQWVDRQLAVARVLPLIQMGRQALKAESEQRDLEWEHRLNDDLTFLQPAWVERVRQAYGLSLSASHALPKPELLALLGRLHYAVRDFVGVLRERRGVVPRFKDLSPEMAWLLLAPDASGIEEMEKRREPSEWIRILDAEIVAGQLHGLKRPRRHGEQCDAKPGDKECAASLDVFYLKLRLPRGVRLDPQSCSDDEFGKEACTYRKTRSGRDFPQEARVDLSFAGEQFRAYRALGREMGKRFCLDDRTVDHDGFWVEPAGARWSRRPLELCQHLPALGDIAPRITAPSDQLGKDD